jgi:ATP-dependent helicase/DNAse subunit B
MRVLTEQSDAMRAAGVFYFRIQSPIVTLDRDTDDAAIKEKIRKEFSLRGITLKDIDII